MNNRRNFLKAIALAGAAATLPVNLLAEEGVSQSVLMPRPVGNGLSGVRHYDKMIRTNVPRTITIPDVGEYKVLKGDFHIHTLFSDGEVMPRQRVQEAVCNGLDTISITDHIEGRPIIGSGELTLATNNEDHNRSYRLARAEAERSNIILVRGAEITKPAWHFNAVFVEDVNAIAAKVDDWRDMLAVSADQGGFNFWDHPYWVNTDPGRFPGGLNRGDPMRFFDEIEAVRVKGHLHGVEVFNTATFAPLALDWCNERNLFPISASDVHASEWNRFGHQSPLRPIQLILAKERNYESVREAFFSGRIVGWAANLVFGRQPWVEQLFRSCVEIRTAGARLTLRSLSDIPCLIEANGRMMDLMPMATLELATPSKLTVINWLVGMRQPLEIDVETR